MSDSDSINDLRGKRVLVTGGRGFIGAAVCRKLRDAGAAGLRFQQLED